MLFMMMQTSWLLSEWQRSSSFKLGTRVALFPQNDRTFVEKAALDKALRLTAARMISTFHYRNILLIKTDKSDHKLRFPTHWVYICWNPVVQQEGVRKVQKYNTFQRPEFEPIKDTICCLHETKFIGSVTDHRRIQDSSGRALRPGYTI